MTGPRIQQALFEIVLETGGKIRGSVSTKKRGGIKPVLILSHGFRGHKDWNFWPYVAWWFAEKGYYTVSCSFSRIAAKEDGLDEAASAEAHTFSQELEDLNAVVRRIKRGNLPYIELANPNRIALIGHSRAGASSILYASEHPALISATAVWNGSFPFRPGREERELSLQQQAILKDLDANKDRFDVMAGLQSMERPVLIVQGSKDNERNLDFFRQLQQFTEGNTFASIEGGDHNFSSFHPFEGSTPQLEEALEVTNRFLMISY